jgi:hypothetical protein
MDEDRLAILRFIFANTDCKIYEFSSEANQDLRCFETFDDLVADYKNKLRDGFVRFNLYSPSMRGNVKVERTEWEEKAWRTPSWSCSVKGWGLIQLYFAGRKDGRIDRSDAGCNSEKRALKWEAVARERLGPVSVWDWKAVSSISNKIYRFIRKIAADKVEGKPILPAAHKLVSEGKAELLVY